MATNNKPTLYYRVVVGHNPSNPAEIIKHPAITRRETYSIERVINAAIDSGRIRGKLYDLYGVINGFMDQMKTLMENGIAINAGFMRLHAELTGQLGDSEQLTAVNGLATCVTPLTALKLDREKFNWQRVDDNGIKLSLSTIKGEGCKIGFVKADSTARINGRNCYMGDGDSVTFVLDGETVACEVLGSDEDTIEIRIPEVAEEHLDKEYVFTVSSHCGIEDGPLQVKTIRAKLLAADIPTVPTIRKATSETTGNVNEWKPFRDTTIVEGYNLAGATPVIELVSRASGAVLATVAYEDGNVLTHEGDNRLTMKIIANTTPQPDGVWESATNFVRLRLNDQTLELTRV